MNKNNWLIKNCTLFLSNKTILEDAILFIKNGKIEWLGHKSHWNYDNLLPNNVEIIDINGGTVLPGFHDAHLHPLIGGVDLLLEFRIDPTDDIQTIISKLKAWKEANPNASFLRGSGWNYNVLSNVTVPKKILDEIFPNIPVFIKSVDGHAAWVNTCSLKLANLDLLSTTNLAYFEIKGGIVELIPNSLEPSGILKEWPAMLLVADNLPKPSFEDYVKAGKLFIENALQFGITSFHDAQAKDPYPQVWHKILSEISIPIKITASRKLDHKKDKNQIYELLDTIHKFNTLPNFKIISVKVFIDGVLEANTAYLLQAYCNNPSNYGSPIWQSVSSLGDMIFELNKYNLPIHAHAVGDAAVRFVLDAIEYAQNIVASTDFKHVNNIKDSFNRHQIVHADLINPNDIPRCQKLGVILNYQPAWFCKDSNFNNITLPALGTQRIDTLYPLADILNYNITVAFSSDWPFGSDIITLNPLEGIQTSVLRYSTRLGLNSELNPNQKISLSNAIKCYTYNSHYASYLDHCAGSLEIGKHADLVIYSENLFEIPIQNLHEIKPIMTLVEGIQAFRKI